MDLSERLEPIAPCLCNSRTWIGWSEAAQQYKTSASTQALYPAVQTSRRSE